MNPQQFLLILRARYKLVFFVLLGTVMATFVVTLLLPKQYTATASVVVDVKSPDPIIGVMLPGMAAPGYMALRSTSSKATASRRKSSSCSSSMQVQRSDNNGWRRPGQGQA